jgi:hypothetical protein
MTDNLIKHIKIYGERNSGTNYLTQLIHNNIKNINIYSSYYKGGTGWKHGFPKINLFDELNSTLFIFIIRDLNSWITSMYYNPYCYKRPDNIKKFIEEPLILNDNRLDHDTNIYKYEKSNIINLRYSKINSYLDFYKKVNNAVFINLENLQKNDETFINFLKNTYNLKFEKYIPVTTHTKNSKLSLKNRNYKLILPNNIKKDKKIENFINNLKNNYYYKSSYQTIL